MKLSLRNEISFLTKIKNFGCRKFVSKCIKELNEACRASRNLQCILLIFSHLYFADQDWPRRGVLRGSKHEVFITYSSHCSVPQALVCSLCDLFHQDMYISSNWAHATSGINRTFDQTINIPLVRKLPSFSFPLQISPIANSLHGLHQISFRTTLYKPASSWKLECITVPQKKCYRVMLSANSNRFHQKSGCAVFLSCEYFITWPRNKVDKYGFAG